ncbi:MAG: hypothetical protein PHP74_00985 [Candidatus Gracilibacteria bacterium]|nr:hypothetical protein [Candidatus Gracilibacteria bacterium]
MSGIKDKILKKLKEGNIAKIPRWKFVLQRVLIWSSLVVAILLASFSISMILFQLFRVEWDLLPRVEHCDFCGIFRVVPYFWLLVSGLLFVFVYFDFKNTKGGYRYRSWMIIGASLLISLILGTCFCFLKTPRHADDLFLKMPMYEKMHRGREMMWNVPDKGVLAGVILDVKGNKALILEDFSRKTWEVDISNVKVIRKGQLLIGIEVRVIGKIMDMDKFFAEEIRIPKFRW